MVSNFRVIIFSKFYFEISPQRSTPKKHYLFLIFLISTWKFFWISKMYSEILEFLPKKTMSNTTQKLNINKLKLIIISVIKIFVKIFKITYIQLVKHIILWVLLEIKKFICFILKTLLLIIINKVIKINNNYKKT